MFSGTEQDVERLASKGALSSFTRCPEASCGSLRWGGCRPQTPPLLARKATAPPDPPHGASGTCRRP
eukprot:3565168-Alexandrium_andersonii.AAC.1